MKNVTYNNITPGKDWLDTSGNKIEAHGGSMFIEDGIFYWIGEDKSHTTKKGKIWTWGINCYSSKDLYNWKYEGHMIEPELENKKSIFYPTRRLDRPHLLKNRMTEKYVLWLKYCDKCRYTILTANKLMGPYHIEKEVYQPFGQQCGDFDLCIENDDAYIFFEVNHDRMLMAKLNNEYTQIEGQYNIIYDNTKPPYTREAPAYFVRKGKHYLITSGMSGYVPNPSETMMAETILSTYRVIGSPHKDDISSSSFNSQISCVFRHPDIPDCYVAMADRWVPDCVMTADRYNRMCRAITGMTSKNRKSKPSWREIIELMKLPLMGKADTSKARYVWLPIIFDGDIPVIEWKEHWKFEND